MIFKFIMNFKTIFIITMTVSHLGDWFTFQATPQATNIPLPKQLSSCSCLILSFKCCQVIRFFHQLHFDTAEVVQFPSDHLKSNSRFHFGSVCYCCCLIRNRSHEIVSCRTLIEQFSRWQKIYPNG